MDIKLRRIGNSLGVISPGDTLRRWALSEGDALELTNDSIRPSRVRRNRHEQLDLLKRNIALEVVRQHTAEEIRRRSLDNLARWRERAVYFAKQSVELWNSLSLWRAAAVVLLGLSIFLFLNKQDSFLAAGQEAMQQDFSDIESFYTDQISEKAAIISQVGAFSDDSFTQDIQKLEAMYTVLKEEMKRYRSEKVKDALVLNMLVRLDLLNQEIHKLEESKKSKLEPAAI